MVHSDPGSFGLVSPLIAPGAGEAMPASAICARVLDLMPSGVAVCRMLFENGEPDDYIHLYTNPAFHVQTGLGEVCGRRITEVIPGLRQADARLFESYSRVAAGGPPERFETYVHGLQRWFAIQVFCPQPEHFVVILDDITERQQLEAVRTFLAQTSSAVTDASFFHALARFLAETLDMFYICVDRLEGDGLNARTLAVWCDGQFEDNVTYALKDTPCGDVVGKQICCFPASVCQYFPRDQVLQDLRAESYLGATLWSHAGQMIGLIALIGRSPLQNRPLVETILQQVAVRASGELERLFAEEALRESEQHFHTLADGGSTLIWTSGLDKLCNYFNQPWLRFTGRRLEQELGNGWAEGVHPDDFDRCLNVYVTAFEQRLPFSMNYRLRYADGGYRWIRDDGNLKPE